MTLLDLAASNILYLYCIMIKCSPFTLGDKTLFRHLKTKKGHKANHTIRTMQLLIPLLICWVIEACVLNISSAILFILLSFTIFDSVCQAGQWQCSAERCAAQCSITGTMQITTFDKKRYNFQAGDCQITAIEVSAIFIADTIPLITSLWLLLWLFMECILHVYLLKCNIRGWVNKKKRSKIWTSETSKHVICITGS